MATDYDKGKVTAREKKAAQRQNAIAEYNAKAISNQLAQQLANYDFADKQNKALRDVQLKQNAIKSETDRFEAQRNLRNAALSLFGSMNQAMNGSTVGNVMRMLEDRNDAENNIYWQQLSDNNNAVRNAYEESYNQNQAAKRDATTSAGKSIMDIQGDLSTNLNNINPSLYKKPGSNKTIANIRNNINKQRKAVEQGNAKLSGYVMPNNSVQAVRNKRNRLVGNDYYDMLINGFNGR